MIATTMTATTENQLRISLDSPNTEVAICDERVHEFDEELDDERSVIQDACSLLSRSAGLHFIVTGFSAERWPVDVETDLAVVLEQLPGVIDGLREHREVTLDFCEQGIERALVMRGDTAVVEVWCVTHHANWEPHPLSITIEREALISMLVQLASDFYGLVRRACDGLSAHPWLMDWLRKIGAQEAPP